MARRVGTRARGGGPADLAVLNLGPLELAIMTVLWQTGEWLTIRSVREQIDYRPVGYTTVATVMEALRRKGYVRRRLGPMENRPGPRRWQFRVSKPLAEHLGDLIAELLRTSPDPGVTLRHALTGRASAEQRASP